MPGSQREHAEAPEGGVERAGGRHDPDEGVAAVAKQARAAHQLPAWGHGEVVRRDLLRERHHHRWVEGQATDPEAGVKDAARLQPGHGGEVALLIPPVPKVVSSEPLALNRATLTRFGVKAGSQRKDRDRRAFVEYLRRGPLRVRLGD
jgi:hypothetical protein